VPRLPDQSPLDVQEVALLEDHDNVAEPPCTTAVGAALRLTVGAGVAGVTETVTLRDVVPPAPLQARVKVVDCASAAVSCDPDVAFVPLQPPDAVHEVALVDDQASVVVPPCATCAGFADSDTVGTAGAALTTTVAVRVVTPPAPEQLSV
jgi:hypothetical protein